MLRMKGKDSGEVKPKMEEIIQKYESRNKQFEVHISILTITTD